MVAEGTATANGAAFLKARYIRGNGLIARQDALGTAYYLNNGHGDVVELRDHTGARLNHYAYDIWGNNVSQSESIPQPFRYSGELWDSTTSLQYLRACWYDPSMGRFINKDTYKGDMWNPLTLNLYTYVENNPLKYIDPSGHKYCEQNCDYTIFVVAGIETSQDFFDDLKQKVIDQYIAVGKDVFVKAIFPYVDNSANMAGQMLDVRHDMMLAEDDAQSSIGGQEVRKKVKDYFAGGELVFIGHSGGGVAGYHGAKVAEKVDGYTVKQVVQIGSPKVRISPSFQERVSYLYDFLDPVPRLGTWAGGFLGLDSDKYAPANRQRIDIIGNHADYFSQDKDDNGVTNLTKTFNAIWQWIKP